MNQDNMEIIAELDEFISQDPGSLGERRAIKEQVQSKAFPGDAEEAWDYWSKEVGFIPKDQLKHKEDFVSMFGDLFDKEPNKASWIYGKKH